MPFPSLGWILIHPTPFRRASRRHDTSKRTALNTDGSIIIMNRVRPKFRGPSPQISRLPSIQIFEANHFWGCIFWLRFSTFIYQHNGLLTSNFLSEGEGRWPSSVDGLHSALTVQRWICVTRTLMVNSHAAPHSQHARETFHSSSSS